MDYANAKRKDILQDLCERMKLLAGQLKAMERETTRPELADEIHEYYRELQDIELNTRLFVLESMQKIGTQKNVMRTIASKANGKKGGRPPKAITELRKRLKETDDFLFNFSLGKRLDEYKNDPEYIKAENEYIQTRDRLEQLTQEWEAKKKQEKES